MCGICLCYRKYLTCTQRLIPARLLLESNYTDQIYQSMQWNTSPEAQGYQHPSMCPFASHRQSGYAREDVPSVRMDSVQWADSFLLSSHATLSLSWQLSCTDASNCSRSPVLYTHTH